MLSRQLEQARRAAPRAKPLPSATWRQVADGFELVPIEGRPRNPYTLYGAKIIMGKEKSLVVNGKTYPLPKRGGSFDSVEKMLGQIALMPKK